MPNILIGLGGALALIGAATDLRQFGFSWLLAFMFFLSICLGSLFLVFMHHAFDASWSVPIRRFCEHLACLAPWLAGLFIPIAILAPKIYPWMTSNPLHDHALRAKYPLFTPTMFYLIAVICFGVWIVLSNRLRHWSLKQDQTGEALCTIRMRQYTGVGIFLYAITLTLGAIMWVKALEHQWYSTMYGVYYFAESVWTTLATVYLITIILDRQGYLRGLIHAKQLYFIGSLLFAFTVFYAYVSFAQYFIIWNANMPEETFWFVQREKGTWWALGQILIFGHFFVPFLAIIRIDAKLKLALIVPLFVWAWLMHFVDMSFNIMPVLHPENFHLHYATVGALAFMGGLLTKVFLRNFLAHPPYPQRDPRIAETLDAYVPPASAAKGVSTGGTK